MCTAACTLCCADALAGSAVALTAAAAPGATKLGTAGLPEVLATVWLVVFETSRLVLRLAVLAVSFRFLVTAARGATPIARDERRELPPGDRPRVTVQLPLRNEYHVAHRAIENACALDYPTDRLEIQVLDDSDDATRDRVATIVAQLRSAGHDIKHLTRPTPTGYKAGALNLGLAQAGGDYVAIFDADCLPQPDFLRRVLPWFDSPDVGLVQGRWSFVNRDATLLTRVQAAVLDGMFVLDQHVAAQRNEAVQFNGTGGLWRRCCLEELGGWEESALTEDAELSLRAHLHGWRLHHLRQVELPSELPTEMAAFRIQQARWADGTAQVLRRGLRLVLGGRLAWGTKVALLLRLGRHLVYPLLLLSVIASPLTTMGALPFFFTFGAPLNLAVLGLLVAALLGYHAVAARAAGLTGWGAIGLRMLWGLGVIPLAVGLSLRYTVSLLVGVCRRGGEFVRTPKAGSGGPDGPRYRPRWDPLVLVELPLGAAIAVVGGMTLAWGAIVDGTLMLGSGVAIFGVGLASLPAPLGLRGGDQGQRPPR